MGVCGGAQGVSKDLREVWKAIALEDFRCFKKLQGNLRGLKIASVSFRCASVAFMEGFKAFMGGFRFVLRVQSFFRGVTVTF